MQDNKVKSFKYDLANYNNYQDNIKELTDKIEDCYYQLSGVHSPDATKIPTKTPKNIDNEYKLRDNIEQYESLKKAYQTIITYCDIILDRMDEETKQATIDIYVNGMRTEDVAQRMFTSRSALNSRITREIKKSLIY